MNVDRLILSPDAWRLVVVESPFAAPAGLPPHERRHAEGLRQEYRRAALRDCFDRGEAPFASHGLYPGALDDDDPNDRARGIAAGFAWGRLAVRRYLYLDLGCSRGMLQGLAEAGEHGQEVYARTLGEPWARHAPADCTCARAGRGDGWPVPCAACAVRAGASAELVTAVTLRALAMLGEAS